MACFGKDSRASSLSVRYLEPGESLAAPSGWVACLPDLKLAVRRDGDTYVAEHVPHAMRSLVERSLCAEVLAEVGGVVLHSSAVLVGNAAAYLFVGPSGSGKSTVARNTTTSANVGPSGSGERMTSGNPTVRPSVVSSDFDKSTISQDAPASPSVGPSGAEKGTVARNATASLIADDTVLILRGDEGLRVRGTPHGQGNTTHDATDRPIAGFCFLAHSSETRAHGLAAAEALTLFFPALFLPPTKERHEEPAAPRSTIETLMELVSTVPCWHLAVPLGYRFDPGDLP